MSNGLWEVIVGACLLSMLIGVGLIDFSLWLRRKR